MAVLETTPRRRASCPTTSREWAGTSQDRAGFPWSVDRWGRLIAGVSVLVCTALGLLHHQLWLVGSLACAFNLVLTSFTDRCAVRALLCRLGAREREDLFFPGGAPRQPQDPR